MSFGFFLSTICNNSMDAMKMSIGACFPHMLLCGIIWPLEGIQHTWLRGLTWIFPHTSAVQGMRDIMLRGWGVESSAVIFGIIIPTVWIIVFLGVSWRLVKIKMRWMNYMNLTLNFYLSYSNIVLKILSPSIYCWLATDPQKCTIVHLYNINTKG